MSETPLFAAPLHGLRTWTVVGDPGAERLEGPHQGSRWPAAGGWLEATCTRSEHPAPSPGCGCGLHAWHPSRRSARRVLAGRREIPGIAEAGGTIEVHEEGFRAQRARPFAFVLLPGRNARLLRRLADAYGAQLIEVEGADALLAFCRERGLGLDEAVVEELMGPLEAEKSRRSRHGRARADALRLAAAIAVVTLLVVAGLQFATDPPGERVLHGRTGEIPVGSR